MNKQKLQSQLDAMKEFFDRSTRVLEEADSNFAPSEGMFTVAAQVAHTAQTIEWFMEGAFSPNGFDMDHETMDAEVRGITSLTAARTWLEEAFNEAATIIEAHSDSDWSALLPEGPIMGTQPRYVIFGAINEHTAHHRGALTVYSRLLGKAPAMPYMDM